MPLTKEFRETILEDLADPEFRSAYLADAIRAIREGELSVAARMLRSYLEAARRGFVARHVEPKRSMMSGKTYAELLDGLDPEERKRVEHRAAGLIAEERRRVFTEATLTSNGQVTIPKEIREGLRMKTGDRMTFTLLPNGTVLMRVKNKSALSVAGRLFKKGRKALPVEDLSR